MILIMGTVRIPEDKYEQGLPAMKKMISATLKEDGCIRYGFARDILDPGLIHISEAWRDSDAVKAHGKSAHMAEWRAAAGDLGLSDRDLKLHQADEGLPI
ncbi:putative quinol monooxygenase [Tsuneonella mangrovi]|uniref:putative quinol monooxygenase n=1 Tax=Tsuneonella mangrovi TaxID=1982042 RepID=UPI000BA2A764|nr:putative quinol monooxygenase [Tsuneonella mangrovi]